MKEKQETACIVPFTEIDRAMKLIETREAFKVILDFDA